MSDITNILLGGVLVIAGGYFNGYLQDKRRHKNESKNLALAFKGEISALSTIAEKRHYLGFINDAIDEMQKTKKPLY